MKPIFSNVKTLGIAAIATLCITTSCSDILDEEPRSSYVVEYFQTEEGIEAGITSMYAHLRYIFGQAYFYNMCETGTDEYTWGQSADDNFLAADLDGSSSLTADNSRADVLWTYAFPNINTASGVIQYGEEAGIDASLIAEAYFFRAFDYFYLVQTFGGVPLDLGAGELAFNTSTTRTSTRNTVPEVYTKCIFPDLLQAVSDLPDTQRLTGTVTKTVARLFLAKAYLTYAWWLENPNSIPTYPTCDRTDPDGKTAAQYYQLAYDYAMAGINNPGDYGLQTSFYLVNEGSNDRNSECMLYADHTEDDEYYNGGSLTYGSGSAPDNFAGWMVCWNYTSVLAKYNGTSVSPLIRVAEQDYGRPWIRMATPTGVHTSTFEDKTYDSRYDATFTLVYRGNWSTNSQTWESVEVANGMSVEEGEPILRFLLEDDSSIEYPSGSGDSNVGAGVLPDYAEYVVGPSGISRLMYPSLWKIGTYRTDNGTGTGSPNAGSTRPYVIAKFSELYLIAAEAAVKGATTTSGATAYDLVNVLRARAGIWTYHHANKEEVSYDYSEEVIAQTPTTIDIDYILAERSREFFGEGYRWYDLVRTQKWNDYADTYTICGSSAGDHTPVTYSRTINPGHYLRPIPTSQLDALEMTDDEKVAYQNPEYQNQ